MEAAMEVPEQGRITDGSLTSLGEKSKSRSVVVVVDATKELQLAGLQYALDHCVRKGDTVWLLGILHRVQNPSTSPPSKSIHAGMFHNILGYKQTAASSLFNGTSQQIITAEINKKTREFSTCVHDPELEKLYQLKEVVPKVVVCAGPSRKMATVKHAEELRANFVILDKNLRKDKEYLMEHLHHSTIVIMEKKGGRCIKVASDNEDKSAQSDFRGGLDDSLDFDKRHDLVQGYTGEGLDESVDFHERNNSDSHFLERVLNHLKSMIASLMRGRNNAPVVPL